MRSAAVLGAAVVCPDIVPSSLFGVDGQVSPANRITVGCIGVGGEGGKNLNAFLHQPDSKVVAVCDVDKGRREEAKYRVDKHYGTKDCSIHTDFREIIARKDIDAVMVSTPDHWHVPVSLMAIRAGKDVICEKPTLTIEEGRVLSDTVRRHGAVFRTCAQRADW
jgi:predicted dehydrogenase